MRQVFGLILIGFAALLLLIELVSLIDPVAKDADPYRGLRRLWWPHAVRFTVAALLAIAGARLAG